MTTLSPYASKMISIKEELVQLGLSESEAQSKINDCYNLFVKPNLYKLSALKIAAMIFSDSWKPVIVGLVPEKRKSKLNGPHLWQCNNGMSDMYGNTYNGNF
ncbi:hypothetical protein ACX818_001398 [Acinetobacter baumannii]